MGKKVKLGLIGLGGRGMGLLKLVFVHHEDVEFAAVCDVYEDRCQEAAKAVEEAGRPRPLTTQNYKEILAMPEVDAVILCTSWENHLNIAIEAMEAGKYVGCEVGGAYSVQECWKIVEAYERTHVPVMLMENASTAVTR